VTLTGWTNFQDQNGVECIFKKQKKNIAGTTLDVATAETMEKLSLAWIRELHRKVTEANAPGADEVKV
jgi:hypothetical protein